MSDKPIRPFQVEQAPKAGLIGQLFGRVPRATAFVHIRNILATTPFEQVRQSDIVEVLARAKLRCRDATKELSLIFEQAALLSAEDRELSETDRRGLVALQRAFELTDAEAETNPGIIEMTVSLDENEQAGMFLFVLLMLFGHGVYV